MIETTTHPVYPGIPEPRVEILAADWFRVLDDWSYNWTHAGVKVRSRVLAGFEFDGASVPKMAHWIVGRWDLGRGPPMAHDALYRCGGDLRRAHFGKHPRESAASLALSGQHYAFHECEVAGRWVPVGHVWTRSEVDRLFGRHMREAGVPRWRRRAAYLAVRVGGRGSWQG